MSPSRSSQASCTPVDAPEGTDARNMPSDVNISTSTVGLPRESRISQALTAVIVPAPSAAIATWRGVCDSFDAGAKAVAPASKRREAFMV